MKGLIIFLAVSTLIAAIPLEGRPAEESIGQICAAQTPCAWAIYKPDAEVVDQTITNSYCKCGTGTTCQFYEKVQESTKFEVHRCSTKK